MFVQSSISDFVNASENFEESFDFYEDSMGCTAAMNDEVNQKPWILYLKLFVCQSVSFIIDLCNSIYLKM